MRGGRSIVRSPGEKRRAWSKNVKRDSPPAFLLLCVCNPSSLTPFVSRHPLPRAPRIYLASLFPFFPEKSFSIFLPPSLSLLFSTERTTVGESRSKESANFQFLFLVIFPPTAPWTIKVWRRFFSSFFKKEIVLIKQRSGEIGREKNKIKRGRGGSLSVG